MDTIYQQLHDLTPDDPPETSSLSGDLRELARAAYSAGFHTALAEAVKLVALDRGDAVPLGTGLQVVDRLAA